jgi:membrane dipeptidase
LRKWIMFAFALVLAAPAMIGCGGDADPAAVESFDHASLARTIAQETIIIDTHVDVPYRLKEEMADISNLTEDGHFDFPRAIDGGLNAPFMSIYIPAEFEKGGAKELADELIDMVEKFQTDWPEQFAVVTSPDQIQSNMDKGIVSLPMGMENGSPMEGDLANLHHFFDRGIRYITLTHSRCNHIGDSSYDEERTWHGLSPFGVELVQEMNKVGMMVDISHVSDETFSAVMATSQAPVIASHSSCRHFTPDFERNMSDEMIQELAEGGGVLQINFGSAFLLGEAQKQSWDYWDQYQLFIEEHNGEASPEDRAEFKEAYWSEHKKITGNITTIADHIDHVVDLVGIDHVGIGSDYDGIGTLPVGMEDVSTYPNLIEELLIRGYSRTDIEKILSGNLIRVWKEVEQIAQNMQAESV